MKTIKNKAPFWAVRFETNTGSYHPVWWGKKDGPDIPKSTIKQLAEKYLSERPAFLKKIDDIYIP